MIRKRNIPGRAVEQSAVTFLCTTVQCCKPYWIFSIQIKRFVSYIASQEFYLGDAENAVVS